MLQEKLYIAVSVLAIAAMIAWHELGHYAAARLLGMRVLKFSIGFGPRLWGIRVGEIDYQLAALPFGGFVQIKGMTPLEEDALTDPRSFVMRPRWARWLVLAAGPAFNYVMAFAMFFVYLAGWPSPMAADAVELTSVPDTFTCDLGCPDQWQCLDDKQTCAPAGFVAGADRQALVPPAKAAGLEDGDFVLSVDGVAMEAEGDFRGHIIAKQGEPITLAVLRGDQHLEITVRPVAKGGGFAIGVAPQFRTARRSVLGNMELAAFGCWNASVQTLTALGAVFRHEPGAKVSSVVEVVNEMKDQLAAGPERFVKIIALVSINLGLLNILPVPALDGIKMLFLMIEGVRRRDIHAGFQVWVNAVGFVAIFGLMVVLMARDTLRHLF
ncbi:MAG TPA: M50 family metallopeptidase [Myxococcota bacterium]